MPSQAKDHKRETEVTERGDRKELADHRDQREEAHRDHDTSAGTVTPNTQNERRSVSRSPVVRSSYGSVDKVSVCRSCQHLYSGNTEVVLSPASLENHASHHDHSNPSPVSLHRPWAARKYEGLCDCGASASGGVCRCAGQAPHNTLHSLCSCSAPYWKKVKVAALVLAAILPWVFLIAYIVLTSL